MVTWEYYQEQFPGGCIPKEWFNVALMRAQLEYLHLSQWYRLEPRFPDSKDRAQCAMAEAMYMAQESEVAQKTVGNVSVRYEKRKSPRQAAYAAMKPFYKIYRGVSYAVPW